MDIGELDHKLEQFINYYKIDKDELEEICQD